MATISAAEETQFKASFREFYAEINAGDVERFYPSEANKSVLAKAINVMNLPWQEKWNKNLWHWAYSANLSKLESRPADPEPEKKNYSNQEWVNIGGRYVKNHAYEPENVDPNEKSGAQILAETLLKGYNNASKLAEVKTSNPTRNTPFKVNTAGMPDPSLPDNDPKVVAFLVKMQKEIRSAAESPEAYELLQTYSHARNIYKQTHLGGSNG